MRIIKLNAIDSTNSYLRQLSAIESVEDFTMVVANFQTAGRGQMGTNWSSQDSKNLTVSVFKDISFLETECSFYISIVVSLSIFKALKSFQIKKLKVKWPNDILSDNKKVAGVLIENVIKQNQLQASIIGIGLNVNQTEFGKLIKASSLRLIMGKTFDLDEILHCIVEQLKVYFRKLQNGEMQSLKDEYEQHLFRKDKPSTFMDSKGEKMLGIIHGVSNSGNLQIKTEEGIKEFDLKAITLLY